MYSTGDLTQYLDNTNWVYDGSWSIKNLHTPIIPYLGMTMSTSMAGFTGVDGF